MTTTVKHGPFKAPNFSLGRYLRREYMMYDANLHYGDVRPFACPQLVCEGVGTKDLLYPLPKCECLGFNNVPSIVEGFSPTQYLGIFGGDLYQSTVDTLCAGGADCLAGTPFYPDPPSVENHCSENQCDGVGVAYVITYVSTHDGIETESSPSPPSAVVPSGGEIPDVTVIWGSAPSGYCITSTRLYRVESTWTDGTNNASMENAEWVLVDEFNGSGSRTYRDTVPSCDTGGPLLTYLPMVFPAPRGELVDVCRTLDGIAVAEKHRVYISRPGEAMFTSDAVVEIRDEVQAIRAIDNTIFVFTNHRPHKIGYRHTEGTMSIDLDITERDLPLASVRSLSVWGSKIYFSSTYSLYEWDIGGYGSDIKSQMSQMLTPEQWRNVQPETVRGVAYEYGYMFTCDGLSYSVMVEYGKDGTDTNNQYSMMPITYIKADSFATNNDGIIMYNQDGNVYSWDWRREFCTDFTIDDNIRPVMAEQCDCCPWRVAFYHDNEAKNHFSKIRVEWDERSATHINATFKHHAFGRESTRIDKAKVISSRGFSIPQYKSAQTTIVELSGCGIMHEVRFATSNQELVTSSNAVAE